MRTSRSISFIGSPLAFNRTNASEREGGEGGKRGKTRRLPRFPLIKRNPHAPRTAHVPTAESRLFVERMIANGMKREVIARVVGVDEKTLRKHYDHELSVGAEVANERVAATLYEKAIDPKGSMASVVAAIFWMKTRARWKEISGVEHSGPDGDALLAPQNGVFILPDNGRDPELRGRLARPVPKEIEAPFYAPPKLLESQ